MAWRKAGSETLTSADDEINVTVTPSICNIGLVHWVANGTVDNTWKTGYTSADTGQNYAGRESVNGNTDGAAPSQYRFDWGVGGYSTDSFSVFYFLNIATNEKLVIEWLCHQNVAGATAPFREEFVGKWVNTSNQAGVMQVRESLSGTDSHLASNSNISVLGSDAGDIVVQDGAIFYETDNNKSYVLYNGSWTEL